MYLVLISTTTRRTIDNYWLVAAFGAPLLSKRDRLPIALYLRAADSCVPLRAVPHRRPGIRTHLATVPLCRVGTLHRPTVDYDNNICTLPSAAARHVRLQCECHCIILELLFIVPPYRCIVHVFDAGSYWVLTCTSCRALPESLTMIAFTTLYQVMIAGMLYTLRLLD